MTRKSYHLYWITAAHQGPPIGGHLHFEDFKAAFDMAESLANAPENLVFVLKVKSE